MRSDVHDRPIDVAALLTEVASPANGAAILFVGTVREVNDGRAVTGIDYTAYTAMARRELAAIVREAAERFEIAHLVVEHRLGHLALGEASVAVAVAHARRARAYEASRYLVEELKRRVPIWKREHYADGTREWVDPSAAHESIEPATGGPPPDRASRAAGLGSRLLVADESPPTAIDSQPRS